MLHFVFTKREIPPEDIPIHCTRALLKGIEEKTCSLCQKDAYSSYTDRATNVLINVCEDCEARHDFAKKFGDFSQAQDFYVPMVHICEHMDCHKPVTQDRGVWSTCYARERYFCDVHYIFNG